MTDLIASEHRRFADPRIDKIERDLGALSVNVSGLQTTIALGNQASTFIADTIRRLEAGQAALLDELRKVSEAMLTASSDPLATPAGRAAWQRLDAIDARLSDHGQLIDQIQRWRDELRGELAGTVRLLKLLAAATSIAATILSVAGGLSLVGHVW